MMRFLRIARLLLIVALSLSCALLLSGCNMLSSGSHTSSGGSDGTSGAFSISGNITPLGNAAGTIMKLSGAITGSTTTDASGNYAFTGLPAGSYTVTPSKTEYDFNPQSKTLPVGKTNAQNINFTASETARFSISGTITPVSFGSGATVTLTGASKRVVTADASGNFTFPDLRSGSYTVTPGKSGFRFTPAAQPATVKGANVKGLMFASAFDGACLGGGATANFFVATYGNDSWSGTRDCPNPGNTDGPFASIARAQQAVQAAHAKTNVAITVMVRGGTYYLPLSPTSPGTLNFTSSDSGSVSGPITWQNYPSETPVISGGLPVTGWIHVSGALWQAPLPLNTQPFEYLFYNGERRLRSRLQSSLGVGYYVHGESCISTQSGQTVSMDFCNLGTFLRIAAEVPPTGSNANCPYASYGGKSKCLDRFQYNPSDPVGKWANLSPPKGNPCNAGPKGNYPPGDVGLTLFGAYTVDVMRVSCVDPTTHILYLTGPTNGSNTSYDYFGPTAGHRYVVENTKDAFDAAQTNGQTGVWFLDRSTSPWTLNYLASYQENPSQDTVMIPQIGGEIPGEPAVDYVGASLLMAANLQYVTFSGLTFEGDDFVPSSTGFNNDSNVTLAVPQAVDCESCQNVTFDGVVVRHTSGSGLTIASTAGNKGTPASNVTVQNGAFYDIGASGVRIGRMISAGDKAPYVPQSLLIQNNLIQGYSRIFANGEGVAMGNGHDVTISHNDINDGYHAGVSICLWGCFSYNYSANGINITTQYNHIWNVMQGITSDGGALYYDIGGDGGSGTGGQILNNLVHDVTDAAIIDGNVTQGSGYGGHGIYLDIQTAGVLVANNVVYRVGSGGLTMTQGPAPGEQPDTFTNNIVAYARRAAWEEQNPWPQNCTNTLRANVTHNLFYFDLNTIKDGYYPINTCEDSCGMSFNQFQNFQGNLYWRTDGTFASDPNGFYVLTNPPPPNQSSQCSLVQHPTYQMMNFSQWQNGHPIVNGVPLSMNEDLTGTASVDPGFGTTGQSTDFLLSSAPVGGFNYSLTNDTINTAGRSNVLINVSEVPATFPTYNFTKY